MNESPPKNKPVNFQSLRLALRWERRFNKGINLNEMKMGLKWIKNCAKLS